MIKKNGFKLIKMINCVLVNNHVQMLVMKERIMKLILKIKHNANQLNVNYQIIILIQLNQLSVLKNVHKIPICGIKLMKIIKYVLIDSNVHKSIICKSKIPTNVLNNVQKSININKKIYALNNVLDNMLNQWKNQIKHVVLHVLSI